MSRHWEIKMWKSPDRTWACGNVCPEEDPASSTEGSAHCSVSSCPLGCVHLSFLRVWRLKSSNQCWGGEPVPQKGALAEKLVTAEKLM
jgi:hypothetical protein